jgi:TctA family transporter
VPLIGIWVKLLRVPYRFLFPSALFFIAVGVYSVNNSLFEVGEVLVFGLIGAVFIALEFSVAPILLGYVLGPMIEVNFRRALLLSHGDMTVFLQHPISCAFLLLCTTVIAAQVFFQWRGARRLRRATGSVGSVSAVKAELHAITPEKASYRAGS